MYPLSGKTANSTGSVDFPGGSVVKKPPCSAEDAGWIPGQGTKISYVPEQLNPLARSRECVGFSKHSTSVRVRLGLGLGTTTGESMHCNERFLVL